ncbi:MAG: tRNA (adenosine(37)-N6)-dimethylallyltransferase MiaA [Candidatus Zambryskibacteria bacterium CG10_big_fil_rev_8_21_14_0_10_42_12]|uniref:tRNA dimethylallyltransferase n=1 Tax=Candidatus Zambryskibacteria bacterium CG10_big_fil_rev_8_21_14_0_10_42_12 TaxID=1975115 RepID=A0A2H0QVI8_9BACT|nr:MAG: tRNA (adenosine(37)-N6)-dimethylallyltransferase MiaA [Candidatus Zambryskibacteria bacterium CG10_big_fil_rev_8_21_14_0_10_42_12]
MALKKKTRPRVIAIVGPTASGKSDLAVLLAQKIGGEVISADSRQVYKGLDIGTGKITKREMRGVPHHLLDVTDPKKTYTVAQFTRDANKTITNILDRSKAPIVCGGTGFYIDALLLGQTFPEVLPNKKLRNELQKQSTEKLFETLKKLDPERAQTIDHHNKVRLIRAIEIVKSLGKVPKQKNNVPYDVTWIGIKSEPEELKKRIHDRLISRMKKGMVTEAQRLHENRLSYKRMRELGLEYRYLADYLQNKISKEKMIVQLEKAIVDYAKRQMTWFKRNKEIKWIEKNEIAKILNLIRL